MGKLTPVIYRGPNGFTKMKIVTGNPNQPTECIPLEIDDKMEERYAMMNDKYFHLEMNNRFDRWFALFFGLVPYKIGPTGEKTLY